MRKCLIYQVYVGQKNKLYDFCAESVKNYCGKYSIDYVCQTEPILKIVPKNSQRSSQAVERLGYLPIYEKENAFDYLNKYDSICIVDSDIYIRQNSPNVFDSFPIDFDFGAVVEREMPITQKYKQKIRSYSKGQYSSLKDIDWKWNDFGAEFMNMGLMIFNKSIVKYLKGQTTKEFITRPEFEDFVNGKGNWKWSTDQTLLNYWIRKEKMKIKNMDWKWNALYKGVEDNRLSEAYFIHFFLKDHLPDKGNNIDQMLKEMKIG